MSAETNEKQLTAADFNIAAAANDLVSLATRLTQVDKGQETFMILATQAWPIWPTTFAGYDDFVRNALIAEQREVLIYTVSGRATKIVVPCAYADKLDEVRKLRLANVQAQLAEHEYGNRVLPEDLIGHIDELPEGSYIGRIFLQDEVNPHDTWVQQSYNSSFASTAAREINGDVRLFKKQRDELLRGDLLHEWLHAFYAQFTDDERELLQFAIELERGGYVPSTYMLRSYEEHWAVFGGEELLCFDGGRFFKASQQAPIRSAVFMQLFGRVLEKVAVHSRCHSDYLKRVQYFQQIAVNACTELNKRRDMALKISKFLVNEDCQCPKA